MSAAEMLDVASALRSISRSACPSGVAAEAMSAGLSPSLLTSRGSAPASNNCSTGDVFGHDKFQAFRLAVRLRSPIQFRASSFSTSRAA